MSKENETPIRAVKNGYACDKCNVIFHVPVENLEAVCPGCGSKTSKSHIYREE